MCRSYRVRFGQKYFPPIHLSFPLSSLCSGFTLPSFRPFLQFLSTMSYYQDDRGKLSFRALGEKVLGREKPVWVGKSFFISLV
jgi:hypothetical protein